MNKIVARFADGRIVKGTTVDFLPAKDRLHLREVNAPAGTKPVEILTADLKALIFVKDFAGDPQHVERNEFDPAHAPSATPIRVAFKDGEVLVGATTGYRPGRPGLFVTPADPTSNIDRCWVVAAATQGINLL